MHSGSIKQYARLLLEKYYRRYLTDSFSRIALLAESEEDLGKALGEAQSQLQKITSVTGDSLQSGDTLNADTARFSTTVTSVTKILEKGLPDWKEQAHLDALQSESGISKASFAHLIASLRCQFDEVMPEDKERFNQLVDWHNAFLDFKSALPDIALDLLHDAAVLNVDPISLWQYLLPAVLSLVGKKNDLDVQSHRVPAIAWTCAVSESGTGKSRAEGLILAPLKEWQQQEFQRFNSELKEYKQVKAKSGESQKEDSPPVAERKYLFEVATIQAVMKRLFEQLDNGSLWARDEIAGLFKSLGQFSANGDGEGLECLLKLWDGCGTQVDRVLHEDSYNMPSTRLSIAGGIQPGVFRKIFSDPDDANGMQARFLFAMPKVQPAKRVKGACRLADKLPNFYRWVDTQFPAGTLRLSRAADARYDAVYEQIGISAELGRTPAIRVWLRKLSGQLLRIALALHIIECYHQPNRPRHEIQLDTLNRAIKFVKYYRSAFQVVQEFTKDSDDISSILVKIWDLAATSPSGLAVRDAYRSIKALPRRAKELGRNVAAYTTDLYCQLEKMGQGTVQKCGRLVRFVAIVANAPTTPEGGGADPVTVVTVPEATAQQAVEVSPSQDLSPVTDRDLGGVGTGTGKIDVQYLSAQIDSVTSSENSATGKEPDDALSWKEEKASDCLAKSPEFIHEEPATTTEPAGSSGGLLNEEEMAAWHEQMNACQTFDDTFKFFTALDALSQKQRHQFESSVPEDTWTWLWNLPSDQEQEPESIPTLPELESYNESKQNERHPKPTQIICDADRYPQEGAARFVRIFPSSSVAVNEPKPESKPAPELTLEELKALLLACDSLVQLNEIKRSHSKTVAKAYDSMSAEEQARVDALAATAVPHKVFKYLGEWH